MSLNATPSSDRIHIGIFGKTNAGKSSIINALTGQSLAIVSALKGTTTDPVTKAMELLPLGPVVMIDTPGIDDDSSLGEKRIEKAISVMNKTDIALVVADGKTGLSPEDENVISRLKEKNIPYIVVLNKSDEVEEKYTIDDNFIWVSAKNNENIYELKERIAKLAPTEEQTIPIAGDLLNEGDIAVLVVPVDKAAPKGRLILPQQQTIRDILDHGAVSVVCRDTELEHTLKTLGDKVKLVITDSQAFGYVSSVTPKNIPLTSFSILMARHKGTLMDAIEAVRAVENLQDNDYVLISEGCTHHRQCEDIGTVKLPKWISKATGKKLNFEFTSGGEFPLDLSKYKVIIHCGGCMLNEREMQHRAYTAREQSVPMTNYGILIAYVNGILERSLEPLGIMLKK